MAGLSVGAPPHLVDAMEIIQTIWSRAMEIIQTIWSRDGKYASESRIQRCWRKAAILKPDMNENINKTVGTAAEERADKRVVRDLCELMIKLKIKCDAVDLEINESQGTPFHNSFTAEDLPGREELTVMAETGTWAEIEDDPDIINAEIDEELEALEAATEEEMVDGEEAVDGKEVGVGEVLPPYQEEEEEEGAPKTLLEAEEMIRKLKSSLPKLGLPPQSEVHLDRLAKSIHKVKAAKVGKDITLHAYFTVKKN